MSILSPALFNLYIEPLTKILKQAGIAYHLYADDIQIYLKTTNPEDITLLNTLTEIQSWLRANHLKLNSNKTKMILFTPKGKRPLIQNWITNLDALKCTLSLSNTVKSLGITLDESMSMNKHIKDSANSAYYTLKTLRKIKPFIPQEYLKTVVQSQVLSKLDYGNSTITGTPNAS